MGGVEGAPPTAAQVRPSRARLQFRRACAPHMLSPTMAFADRLGGAHTRPEGRLGAEAALCCRSDVRSCAAGKPAV